MHNAFEQINSLQPGPEHCFEEVVSTILRATIPEAKRVRVYRGDGGVDTFTGTWGEAGELEVYQIKYFISEWTASQQQQIRESYQTAAENPDFNLSRWTLIVPRDLTAKDFKWFDGWRAKQKHKIELINGSDLTDRLLLPQCAGARQMLKAWGVIGLHAGPSIRAWVRVIGSPPYALVVNAWLENIGDRSLRSARLRIQHSETHTVSIEADDSWWRTCSTGMLMPLNPRQLEAVKVINPGDKVLVLSIPFREVPNEDVSLNIEITREDISPITMNCRFSTRGLNLDDAIRFPFDIDAR
jgi:hypothetical protein